MFSQLARAPGRTRLRKQHFVCFLLILPHLLIFLHVTKASTSFSVIFCRRWCVYVQTPGQTNENSKMLFINFIEVCSRKKLSNISPGPSKGSSEVTSQKHFAQSPKKSNVSLYFIRTRSKCSSRHVECSLTTPAILFSWKYWWKQIFAEIFWKNAVKMFIWTHSMQSDNISQKEVQPAKKSIFSKLTTITSPKEILWTRKTKFRKTDWKKLRSISKPIISLEMIVASLGEICTCFIKDSNNANLGIIAFQFLHVQAAVVWRLLEKFSKIKYVSHFDTIWMYKLTCRKKYLWI